jgi:hypothetical protein
MQDRAQFDGHATAYVYMDLACRPPVNDPAELWT